MKILLLTLFLIKVNSTIANMASPYEYGTLSSSPLSSKNIDILSENIVIKIDRKFKNAHYFIEYTIKNEKDGIQIPLLFYAKDFKENFRVWLDNKEMTIMNIPENYIEQKNPQFNDFSYLFNKEKKENSNIKFYWGEDTGFLADLNNLKYFEAQLPKGEHKIRVDYIGTTWMDKWDWVKEYSFRYSLSPAKYWKSFGKLNVTIIQELEKDIDVNLGIPTNGKIGRISKWTFNKLPKDDIEIRYTPKISNLSQKLISIGPFKLMLIFGLIVLIIHLLLIIWYRRTFKTAKYSWAVLIGSIVFPYLILHSYMDFFDIIDNLIGKHASRFHGYTFFIMLTYPFVAPLYWLMIKEFDKLFILKRAD